MPPIPRCCFVAALLLAPALPIRAAEHLEAFGYRWRLPVATDWKLETLDGLPTLRLLVPRPSTQPRRPTQYALAETPDYLELTVEAEVRKEPFTARNRRTSLILVYAWRDENHFNYAHLSVDTGKQAPHHNGIFHVYGGDRVRISSEDGPPALTGEYWHKVRLVYDGATGRVDVWVDGVTSPSLRAVDLSLGAGKFGLGSFFDLGDFRHLRIRGRSTQSSMYPSYRSATITGRVPGSFRNSPISCVPRIPLPVNPSPIWSFGPAAFSANPPSTKL